MASIDILRKPTQTVNAIRKSENKIETAQIAEKNGKTPIDARGRQHVSEVTTRLAVQRKTGKTCASYSEPHT